MKKKTIVAYVAGLTILLGAAPSTLLASPLTPAMATGGVRFTWNGAPMAASFNAHVGTCSKPAKGVLNLREFNCTGGVVKHYNIRVTKVMIDCNTAIFSGQVMAGSEGCGRWVTVWVKDGGTPGRCGDLIGLKWSTGQAACCTPCPPQLAPVTAGNLQVH